MLPISDKIADYINNCQKYKGIRKEINYNLIMSNSVKQINKE
jgi:hypothetical protein